MTVPLTSPCFTSYASYSQRCATPAVPNVAQPAAPSAQQSAFASAASLPYVAPALVGNNRFTGLLSSADDSNLSSSEYGSAWLLPRARTMASLFVAFATLSFTTASLLEKRNAASSLRALQQVSGKKKLALLGQRASRLASSQETETSIYYNEPWMALARMMQTSPGMTPNILGYATVGTLGYLGSNLFQGLQEAWVRSEESCIRGNLVNRLQSAFQSSLQIKTRQDDEHLAYAKEQLRTILKKHNVALPAESLALLETPAPSNLLEHRNFIFIPQNRQLYRASTASGPPSTSLASARTGATWWSGFQRNQEQTSASGASGFVPLAKPSIKAGISFLGAMSGLLAKHCVDNIRFLLQAPHQGKLAETLLLQGKKQQATALLKQTLPKLKETINPNNIEGLSLLLLDQFQRGRDKKALLSLAGIYALSSLLSVGRLLVSGLREIEVTRMNAETELNYERYKWLQLDPMYHRVAERTLLDHALERFEVKLPELAQQPEALKSEMKQILGNVGLWSPPPYYPVTPPVQLVEARS